MSQDNNEVKSKLIAMWYKHTGLLNQIPDDFFCDGGNSLSLSNLLVDIYQQFKVELIFKDIYKNTKFEFIKESICKELKDTTIETQSHHLDNNLLLQASLCKSEVLTKYDDIHTLNSVYELKGNWDIERFAEAISSVFNGSTITKTCFEIDNDFQVKLIEQEKARVNVNRVDFSTDESSNYNDIYDALEKLTKTKISESEAPLYRIYLSKAAKNHYFLIIFIHHFIVDHLSMSILMDSICQKYFNNTMRFSNGIKQLNKVYAQKLYEQQDSPEYQCFKDEFKNSSLSLNFPGNGEEEVTDFAGYYNTNLSKQDLDKLKKMTKTFGLSNFVVLLAVYSVTVYQFTQQKRFIVGVPIDQRDISQKREFGFGVNIAPLKIDFTNLSSFESALTHVKEKFYTLLKFGATNVHELKDVLDYTSGYTLAISYENCFELTRDNLTIKQVSSLASKPKFPITIYMRENFSGISVEFEYDKAFTSSSALKQFSQLFISNLDRYSTSIESSIEYSNETYSFAKELESFTLNHSGIRERIIDNFSKFSHSSCLISDTETITYKELKQRVMGMVLLLKEKDVTVGDRVVVFLNKKQDCIVSMLAIMFMRAVYVPIHLDTPHERIQYIVDDCQASFIITEKNANAFNLIKIVPNKQLLNENLEFQFSGSELAYFIYTSGSTGKPKGVKITYDNLNSLFQGTDTVFQFTNEDNWILLHSVGFDFSIWEIFGALLHGGSLYFPDSSLMLDPKRFFDELTNYKITVLNITPSLFAQYVHYLDAIKKTPNLTLRYIIFGGEALDINIVSRWYRYYPDYFPLLYNMYGITEGTVHATYYKLSEHAVLNWRAKGNIGKSLTNTKIILLNNLNQIVPDGSIGEMALVGYGVSTGYVNNAALNERSFLRPHATLLNLDSKLPVYKTGDLARYDDNGNLIYLGRKDLQIKLRGFRIELSEIESEIKNLPFVQNAIVKVDDQEYEKKHIYSYVVLKNQYLNESVRLQAALNSTYHQVVFMGGYYFFT